MRSRLSSVSQKILHNIKHDQVSVHDKIVLRRVSKASIIWLNKREAQLDSAFYHFGSLEAYTDFLLAECGYHLNGDSATLKEVVVDRYGGSGIGTNGGSGRGAFLGNYYVKGIGRTKLVSSTIDEHHASGGCYLQEAVREAIFGEVLYHEIPGGSIGVLGIIDLGEIREWPAHIKPRFEREVLLVRRAFARPAHLMRAYYFSNNKPASAELDEKRVFATHSSIDETEFLETLSELSKTWACQIAYCYMHRLITSPVSPSNISIHGQVVDFGASTSVPTWEAFRITEGGQLSTGQIDEVLQAVSDLLFYRTRTLPSVKELSAYKETLEMNFIGEIKRQAERISSCSCEGKRSSVKPYRVIEYLKREQRHQFDFFDHRDVVTHSKGRVVHKENELIKEINPERCVLHKTRGPYDRAILYRERLRIALHKELSVIEGDARALSVSVQSLINKYAGLGRRDSRFALCLGEIVGFFRSSDLEGVFLSKDEKIWFVAEWTSPNLSLTRGQHYLCEPKPGSPSTLQRSSDKQTFEGSLCHWLQTA